MRLDAALRGVQKLGVDSAPLIYATSNYATSNDSPLKPIMERVFGKIDTSQIACFASVVVLTEILQKPIASRENELVETYRTLLSSRNFTLVPVDAAIAEDAARLRAVYNLKTPDALMIATALSQGCQAFLTNDDALRRVGEVPVFILKELS